MDQTKFLYMSKKCEPTGEEGIRDNGNGVVIVNLRTGVKITHNYKKNNRIEIIFENDGSRYIVATEKQLESIYKMHLSRKHFVTPARAWCKEHLQPC